MAEDDRKLDIGNVLETQVGTYVVTGVQTTEQDGVKNFTYLIKDPADLIEGEE